MEVITIESQEFRELMEKINMIAKLDNADTEFPALKYSAHLNPCRGM